ncbi:MAG: phosphate signaling complex protein PhoU [Halobacteriovoraceae bacterium]|nr:phosphate signaling complex protein PhoU [Halobacteriovoraceae bacterium]
MAVHLEKAIDKLRWQLQELMKIIEDNFILSIESLAEGSIEKAKKVIDTDQKVNAAEVTIEEECLKILALHQPVAIDLRFVITVLKVNNDLERIGDLTANIAQRAKFISSNNFKVTSIDYKEMSDITLNMLRKSINSVLNQNVALAKEVCEMDEVVDEINRNMHQAHYELIKQNPNDVQLYSQHLSCSKHLERISDYATNIAEDLIYLVEGEIVRHEMKFFKN